MKTLIILFLFAGAVFSQTDKSFSLTDTVNARDTASRLYTSGSNTLNGSPFYAEYTRSIVCDSGTIQISFSASFTSTDIIELNDTDTWTDPTPLNVTSKPNFYIRPKTGSLTPCRYRLTVSGQ